MPIVHRRRCSSLHHGTRGLPPSRGELGSLSVSDVQVEEGAEEKNWGRGDVEREGTGVEGAVDDTEDPPELPRGGRRKFGPGETVELEGRKGTLFLGFEWARAVSVDSVLDELS